MALAVRRPDHRDGVDHPAFAPRPVHPVIVLILEVAAGVVWTGYFNCVIIMIYHDLRVAKEGVDTSQIASVFD